MESEKEAGTTEKWAEPARATIKASDRLEDCSSPERNKLFMALSKAQRALRGVAPNQENEFYNAKYADLGACLEAMREPLSGNGLALIQLPRVVGEGHICLLTVLTHNSGQYISSELIMKPEKSTPQAIGSCLTYMRRYGACAIVGLAQEDDDAERAEEKGTVSKINAKQVSTILETADELFSDDSETELKAMCHNLFGVAGVREIKAENFDEAVKVLHDKKAYYQKKAEKAKKAAEDTPL